MSITKHFSRVLVANRGEIAIRLFRSLSELGIHTVGIYSYEDRFSLFRKKADESYMIGGKFSSIESYSDMDAIISIAKKTNVNAIHPGYGFLAENTEFIAKCEENNITFIGPSLDTMLRIGNKINAKKIASECEISTVPGVPYSLTRLSEVLQAANELGYPVIIKCASGSGGRAIRVVRDEADMAVEFAQVTFESKTLFDDERIVLEKYIEKAQHIEVQLIGDKVGNIVHLYDRDCSAQRHFKNIIDVAPASHLERMLRKRMFDDAIKLAEIFKLDSVATVEFLLDNNGKYHFISFNPYIQSSHTVTELITGIDIIQTQILIEEGYSLHSLEINIQYQAAIKTRGSHAIQAYVTAEDPTNNYETSLGKITSYRSAGGPGIRLDDGCIFIGAILTHAYDSLLVKIVAYDKFFYNAVRKTIRSLKEIYIRGIKTNIHFLINLLNHPAFLRRQCYISFIEETNALSELDEQYDNANKIIEYIAKTIVTKTKGEKPHFDKPQAPNFTINKPQRTLKKELETNGAYSLTQKILSEKKLYITDTTMCSANQSKCKAQIRTIDLIKIAPATNQFLINGFSAEVWGGNTFNTAYGSLFESPWVRLTKLRELMPDILLQMPIKASQLVGNKNYPNDIIIKFIETSANKGIDVFRIIEDTNEIENMKLPIVIALSTGKIVEGSINCNQITANTGTESLIRYYIEKAKQLEALEIHILAINDKIGILTPNTTKSLIEALKKEIRMPIHLHIKNQTESGEDIILAAVEAGVDIVDLAVDPMSGDRSQPSMNKIVQQLKGTQREAKISLEDINKLSNYYNAIQNYYKKLENHTTPQECETKESNTIETLNEIQKQLEYKYNFQAKLNNILSYAICPAQYDKYYEHIRKYGNLSKLETDIFFYGLALEEETTVDMGEENTITIKFMEMTVPEKDAIQTLTFEVNGAIREIEISQCKESS